MVVGILAVIWNSSCRALFLDVYPTIDNIYHPQVVGRRFVGRRARDRYFGSMPSVRREGVKVFDSLATRQELLEYSRSCTFPQQDIKRKAVYRKQKESRLQRRKGYLYTADKWGRGSFSPSHIEI